ncbi:MAG TPA: helicase-related protein [Bacteroidales bacterium]|nr:helicase-related protein [Bacteroidales bacterium]
MDYTTGNIVKVRNRQWVVLPSQDEDLLLLKPLGGTEEESIGIYKKLPFPDDVPKLDNFPLPDANDLGDFATARLLYNASRLSFRAGAGPFRSFGKLSVRPRTYQLVPLIMALKLDIKRLLIADDVGIGKTVEALLVVRELLDRGEIKRFAVVCLPHLCEQWKEELRDKFGIDAEIIRSGTIGKLERDVPGDLSVFQYFPYQILSIDFIKQEKYKNRFINECPELIIVDEAHTCSRPQGASASQQQRYHLLHQLSKKDDLHMILLTATPHSGKQDEFQSLLGLLKPEFEEMDLLNDDYDSKRKVAAHYIQRRRKDVEDWLDEKTPFPQREAGEVEYELSPAYKSFYNELWKFAKGVTIDNSKVSPQQKMRYWTILSLIRGVMSSPDAGVEMLRNRWLKTSEAGSTVEMADDDINPAIDSDFGNESDNEPGDLFTKTTFTSAEDRTLKFLMEELGKLGNLKDDRKASTAATLLIKWIKEGYQPIVFCRFIQTANYLGKLLQPLIKKEFPDIQVEVITSELNDDLRKERIAQIGKSSKRLIFATDCLSEGINLQDYFTAVLHYDLPWNPNRLEQREGRIDRYGQPAEKVVTTLLFGKDNPMDGVVMRVLLEKARQIRKANGITVPFPENNQSIMEAIINAVILNPNAITDSQQLTLDLGVDPVVKESELKVTRAYDKAINDEIKIRNLFAQNPIVKELNIDEDLKETDEALGEPKTVEKFVQDAFLFLGAQMETAKKGWRIYPSQLPEQLQSYLPNEKNLRITFFSPVADGYYYVGRNHPFVEQLCHYLLGLAFIPAERKKVARAAVFVSSSVKQKTIIVLYRVRNLIKQIKGTHEFLAEEMLLWGYEGNPASGKTFRPDEAKDLLLTARVNKDIDPEQQIRFIDKEVEIIKNRQPDADKIARERSEKLVEAHERYRKALKGKEYEVGAVLPMDLMGIYILLPDIEIKS